MAKGKSVSVSIPKHINDYAKDVLKRIHAKEPLNGLRTRGDLYRHCIVEGLEKMGKKYK